VSADEVKTFKSDPAIRTRFDVSGTAKATWLVSSTRKTGPFGLSPGCFVF